jgi:hypothetical protein
VATIVNSWVREPRRVDDGPPLSPVSAGIDGSTILLTEDEIMVCPGRAKSRTVPILHCLMLSK